MNPKNALLIALALNGWTDIGSDPWTCFADGGGSDDGTNKPSKGKTFTQEELDDIVEARLKRERTSLEKKLVDATKAESDKAAALQKQLDDLTAKLEDAGKSAGDKELNALKRELVAANQKLADAGKSIDTLTKERDGALSRHRDEVVSTRFQQALGAAKVLPTALAKAASLLKGESQVEIGEDGKLAVTWNKRIYTEDKLAQLGKDFLADNAFLAAHPGGGTGTKTGGGASHAAGEFNEADFGKGLEAFGRSVARSVGAAVEDDI